MQLYHLKLKHSIVFANQCPLQLYHHVALRDLEWYNGGENIALTIIFLFILTDVFAITENLKRNNQQLTNQSLKKLNMVIWPMFPVY